MKNNICTKCLCDGSIDEFHYIEKLEKCNLCILQENFKQEYDKNKDNIENTIKKIRQDKNEFDCVLGISGGVDSSYLLHLAVKEYKLKPLCVYFNNGFGNPVAGENIAKMCEKLHVKFQILTSDWKLTKSLKKSILLASVPEMTLDNDIGFHSALYTSAVKHNIKWIVTGYDIFSEGVYPLSWNYMDSKYLEDIHKIYGDKDLVFEKFSKTKHTFNFGIKEFFYYRFIKKIKLFNPFENVSFNREEVKSLLIKNYNWKYPGAKYMDDLFQSLLDFILLKKFNIDRRKIHLSARIRNKEIKIEDARKQIEKKSKTIRIDNIRLCLKRLGIDWSFIKSCLKEEPKNYSNYKTSFNTLTFFKKALKLGAKLNIIPLSHYNKFFGLRDIINQNKNDN